ncbi:leucine--tRNA ligase [Guggenheimella bovis]
MDKYNFNVIEKKWQKIWEEEKTFHVELDDKKPKKYFLIEFPYPSGQGLHIGHPRPYTFLDILARKHRRMGENVLFPMGFDAFGLPTENYAIKNKVHPEIVTKQNIERFTKQLKSLGLSFDWDRVINTTDPEYYKWTQWIFLKLYEHGLAYKSKMNINWCPSCKVGLANEEVVSGCCERCGHEVERRDKEQWMLAITKYAERLIQDLEGLDFPERVKAQQINWIGKSEGARIFFKLKGTEDLLEVFSTRPDTIYGATYMVVAPEHPIIEKYQDSINNLEEVRDYQHEAKHKSDFERTQLVKEKTGVKLDGVAAINPVTEKEIPIFISDYVMMEYGTGAIMAVPAHDERDHEFAKKFGAEIIEVVSGGDVEKEAYTGDGLLVNSPLINGLNVEEAKEKMLQFMEEKGIGERKVQYKLRDWVFSRQRYWGEPIPIIHCPHCGKVALKEEDLPLVLPEVSSYEPADDGSSPLSKIDSWVNVKCPKCGADAKRETDTMPQWAGSSWYYLRYLDPKNSEALASKEALKYWMNVDWYNGGMEHTTLHLLYSRFWHKFLYDIGVVLEKEPYQKRTSHGFILGSNGEKMSKSRGNVLNPDDYVENYGADALRAYEMFIGDFEKAVAWSDEGLMGTKKFLDRVWFAFEKVDPTITGYRKENEVLIHQTIEKVTKDFENLKANTAIAQMMTLLNEYYKLDSIGIDEYHVLLSLLNPVAPHLTEELNEMLKRPRLAETPWPTYDPDKTIEDMVELPVQVNGKVRFKVTVGRGLDQDAVRSIVEQNENYDSYVKGEVKKFILIPDKLVSIVVK